MLQSNISTKTLRFCKSLDHITDSVYSAARLLREFGFSRHTLTAHMAVLPIAYYFHLCGGNVKSPEDLESIRQWITRSLLKRRMWTGSQDSLLTRLREVIDEHGHNGFPYAHIEEEILRRGGSLTFEFEELQDLAESKDRAFSLLSGVQNMQKSAELPLDWLNRMDSDKANEH